jgi:DNA recombination-dependent growth factor C
MGLFKGAVSYRRFRLMGELPTDYPPQFLAAVNKRAFRPIEGATDEERSVGWVHIHDPLDTDFVGEKLFFEDQMLLALRIDQKRVPAKVLAAYVQKAEREYMQTNNRESLSRSERRNLRDLVRNDLLARVLPSLATFDAAVNLTEREVRFWSLTRSTCELFQELFEETFGMNLMPMGAFGLASKLLTPTELDKLDLIGPSVFARIRG